MINKKIFKTQSKIYKALLRLCGEKDFDSITVKELCSAAEINKSTFYLHYKSIDDCAMKWIDFVFLCLEDSGIKEINIWTVMNSPKPFIERALDLFESNYNEILAVSQSTYFDKILTNFKRSAVEHVINDNNLTYEDDFPIIATATFAISGMLDTLFSLAPHYNREVLSEALRSMITAAFWGDEKESSNY